MRDITVSPRSTHVMALEGEWLPAEALLHLWQEAARAEREQAQRLTQALSQATRQPEQVRFNWD